MARHIKSGEQVMVGVNDVIVEPLVGPVTVGAAGAAAVVKLHTVPVVVPLPFFSSMRQKYVVLAAIVPGSYVVPAWFWMKGGGFGGQIRGLGHEFGRTCGS